MSVLPTYVYIINKLNVPNNLENKSKKCNFHISYSIKKIHIMLYIWHLMELADNNFYENTYINIYKLYHIILLPTSFNIFSLVELCLMLTNLPIYYIMSYHS